MGRNDDFIVRLLPMNLLTSGSVIESQLIGKKFITNWLPFPIT